ncbi:hypothetical protein P171DRAFT_446832 [Karstenula rhodostoma CBS 690.94]|uniref:Uncharacterized protein n=1 Tax=Karstenula rhodostoma CBS 690.94 TaxID=1392251 RepID=A0A9P4PBI8_9PLEO|nr:hypothetical protein P171DRAFT_446832 [Karstenula rhodostoma CBS 690.94]
MGFCLGAYLAGTDVGSEIMQRGSQVENDEDTAIQVDWTFTNGTKDKGRWLYFQEGAYVEEFDSYKGEVLARYSKTSDIADSVIRYGQGWVGLPGTHPEAYMSWYPDGMSFNFAYGFLAATLNGGKSGRVCVKPPAIGGYVTRS